MPSTSIVGSEAPQFKRGPRRCYQHGPRYGINLRPQTATPASIPAPPPETRDPRDRAPKLNPPKPFDRTRSEFKSFIMQLNLIFSSDDRYAAGNREERSKIAYAASYLAGSAKEWFQPHVNEDTGVISFTI